jgi:hypothetical protein
MAFLGKKACTRKVQLEGRTTRAHARKGTTGRKNNIHAWEEYLTTIGLGFW